MVTYYNFIRVPGGFNPTWGVNGCLVAIYSDLGITKDGSDRVATWADQSGNGNDFIQATDTKKFVYYAGVGPNGYPELLSDSVDDYMETGAFTLSCYNKTVFLVYRNLVPAAGHDGVYSGSSANWDYTERGGVVDPITYVYGGHYWDGKELFSNNAYILVTNGIASDGGNTGYMRKNGVDKGVWQSAVGGDPNGLILGCLWTYTRFSNVGFVAFLIYDSKLGDADRATVEAGLNARYAIW